MVVMTDHATKRGNRVAAQAVWLYRHQLPGVVRVHEAEIGDAATSGVTMERLYPFPLSAYLDSAEMATCVVRTLQSGVWRQPAEVEIDLFAHTEKVRLLAEQYDVPDETLHRVVHEIDWGALPQCLTHGDPTFENTMCREDGVAVLIDPIPATPAVPDLRCVDVGKILQSVYGWEAVRYGHTYPAPSQTHTRAKLQLFHTLGIDPRSDEARAARYWAVVHLLRTLPYLSDHLVPAVRRMAVDHLVVL